MTEIQSRNDQKWSNKGKGLLVDMCFDNTVIAQGMHHGTYHRSGISRQCCQLSFSKSFYQLGTALFFPQYLYENLIDNWAFMASSRHLYSTTVISLPDNKRTSTWDNEESSFQLWHSMHNTKCLFLADLYKMENAKQVSGWQERKWCLLFNLASAKLPIIRRRLSIFRRWEFLFHHNCDVFYSTILLLKSLKVI